jgi:hypothetical protein
MKLKNFKFDELNFCISQSYGVDESRGLISISKNFDDKTLVGFIERCNLESLRDKNLLSNKQLSQNLQICDEIKFKSKVNAVILLKSFGNVASKNQQIEYLKKISKNSYLFRFSISNSFTIAISGNDQYVFDERKQTMVIPCNFSVSKFFSYLDKYKQRDNLIK